MGQIICIRKETEKEFKEEGVEDGVNKHTEEVVANQIMKKNSAPDGGKPGLGEGYPT